MSIRSSKVAVALLAGVAVLALARCGGGEEDPIDTGKKDGGLPPLPDAHVPGDDVGVKPDAGPGAPDTGTTPDTGTKPDGGSGRIETTIPAINNLEATDHPADGKLVHFKGVVMSPVWQVSKSTSNADSSKWSCLVGVYLADPHATEAAHNGVLVVSKTTVTPDASAPADGKKATCNTDSALHKAQGAQVFQVGEELEIAGFYNEYCYSKDGGKTCFDTFGGKDISFPEITSNKDTDIKRTGQNPGAPASLPVTVAIEDITSASSASGITSLGKDFFKYRAVLVKLESVKVTKDSEASCNWVVSPQDGTASLIVDDDVMFDGSTCPHRPKNGATFGSLQGLLYWTFSSSQLSPRGVADMVP